ncbi:MAG: hypothetical protein ACE5KH_01895 [Candidatus Geothermarchaeales archaeon]
MDSPQEEGDEDLRRCWICGLEAVLYERVDGRILCYGCLLRQQREQISLDMFMK